MENCHTIRINNNSLKGNNYTHFNSINNNCNIILNSNNKKKLDFSESHFDQKFNIIKRKKLNNSTNSNILYISADYTGSENDNSIYKSKIEQNLTRKLEKRNKKMHNNNDMSTPVESDIDNISKNTDNNNIDVNSDTTSILPTPPQTPKTSYTIPESEPSDEILNDVLNEEEKKVNTGDKIEEKENDVKPITFDHINKINDFNSCIIPETSDEDDDEYDSNEEYEDINLSEEFGENKTDNLDDVDSTTNLLSASNINSNENNKNNEKNDDDDDDAPIPNQCPEPIPSTTVLINSDTFNNIDDISFESLINQNGETVNYTYSETTLNNSGDSTLIQQSSVSSYIDKEDEEMSESSIYLRKFKIYTASASQPKNPRQTGTLPPICKEDCGEDAYFILDQPNFSALGIADGVGGWTFLGYDPSLFAWDLMNCCKECATTNSWPDPQDILVGGYNKVVEKNEIEAGSSTACIITLDKTTGTVYSSNIGDSGFIVIRDGKVVYQTRELQHYFNAPYQLSVLPEEMKNDPINIMDSPNDAIIDQCTVEEGDVIVLGTDGLWDNIFNEEIVTKLSSSIEKIDDIQIQIKQINDNLYQQQQQAELNDKPADEKELKDEKIIKTEEENQVSNDKKKEEKEVKIDESEKVKEEVKEGEDINEEKMEDTMKEGKEIKEEEKKEVEEIKSDEIKEGEDIKSGEMKKEEEIKGDEINEEKEAENNEVTKEEENKEEDKINDEVTKETENKDESEEEEEEEEKHSVEDYIKKKEELNNECNKILKDIALKLTLDTKEMSRNFDKISPFSYNAKKCGIIHYGG